MNRRSTVSFIATLPWVLAQLAHAQQIAASRVGVILHGGPQFEVLDGLKAGFKDLGLQEGQHFALDVRDAKGDLSAVEEAARSLERSKVSLIYAVNTSVSTRVHRTTTSIPIVFAVGSDPVRAGLVASFANPGGRLTGVHFYSEDLTAKRLSILKETLPGLRRVVTFYNPGNEVALVSMNLAREAAAQLKIEIVERRVASVEELRLALSTLDTKNTGAFYYVSDGMISSQGQLIVDTARARKLPTMFHEHSLVAHGALASYGVSYHEVGRVSARYVQQILAGASPQNLAVESVSRVGLSLNLKTARELGLTIPQSVRLQADKIIE